MNEVIYEIDEIKRRMANQGLGPVSLSRKAGINIKTTQKILNTRKGHPKKVYQLAMSLGIDVWVRKQKTKAGVVSVYDLRALNPRMEESA